MRMKTIFLEGINKDELTLEKPVVATIGFFDGVHLGHQFLINRLAEMAKTREFRVDGNNFRLSSSPGFAK